MNSTFRQDLLESGDIKGELFLLVDGEPLVFAKNGSGLSFLILMDNESYVSRLGLESIPVSVAVGSSTATMAVIGRLQDSISGRGMTIEAEKGLEKVVGQGAKAFLSYVEQYGRWPSFGDFLRAVAGFSPKVPLADQIQLPLEYYWLVGELASTEDLLDANLREGVGIYVKAGDHVLPVFSSQLAASVAAEALSHKARQRFEAEEMPCLGCFLAGVLSEVGSGQIRNITLDRQWEISGQACAEIGCEMHPGSETVRHFRIIDQGQQYLLTGCRDSDQYPRWYPK